MNLKKKLTQALEIFQAAGASSGLHGSAAAFILAATDGPFLVLDTNENNALLLRNDILFYQHFFNPAGVEFLPYPDDPHSAAQWSRVNSRLRDLDKIISYSDAVLSDAAVDAGALRLSPGLDLDQPDLLTRIKQMGYRNSCVVAQEGDYCARNKVLDLFPGGEEMPLRLEFSGGRIASIRRFRVDTQISVGKEDEAIIYPAVIEKRSSEGFLNAVPDRTLYILDNAFKYDDGQNFKALSRKGESTVFRSFEETGIERAERPSFDELTKRLSGRKENILAVLPDPEQAQRFREILGKRGVDVPIIELDSLDGFDGGFAITSARLSEGVFMDGLTILTQKELFGRELSVRRPSTPALRTLIEQFEDMMPGDFVVHEENGVGRFKGLTRQRIEDMEVELASIGYSDGLLQMPLYHMDKVRKFRAEEGYEPDLDRIGGKSWEKKKARAEKKINEMVAGLVDLYAKRDVVRGFSFSKDTDEHREFYSFFPHQETEDQETAIREVLDDMESDTPMDRLLCGDVGFGKTEVAMRAAFKSIYDKRMVVVLVPTTILCEQHVRSFEKRFSAFHVMIDSLSRFKTAPEVKDTIRRVENGEVDILIGTTMLVRRNIKFPRLGLLIIDEEQRFGVGAKEKILQMKKGVDCLMMSATPIPRTMQMALSGIRTISVIESPPEERLSVRTSVSQFNDEMIRQAVVREKKRNGQAFFVTSHIEEIDDLEQYLSKLLPDVRIVSAHSKMKPNELEDRMMAFLNAQYDMLLSTNIIASGIDIPSANTLLVNRADRFGLAVLYQLKGRVGRTRTRAYAYFLLPDKEVTETAQKRLEAIEQLNYLGAGLKVAMKDLEIRGAGNLFGYKQSGQINELGFDMYEEMLRKEVARIRGQKIEEKQPQPVMDIGIRAYIPSEYVSDDAVRFSLYRRLLDIQNQETLDRFREELDDRFGMVPDEASTLFDITALRMLAARLDAASISVNPRSFSILMPSYLSPEFHIERLQQDFPGLKILEKGFQLRFGQAGFREQYPTITKFLAELRDNTTKSNVAERAA